MCTTKSPQKTTPKTRRMAPSNANNDALAIDLLQEHDVAATMPLPKIPLDSFTNALVLLPPPSVQASVNALRCANDKSHPRWTAHLTLVFPFVGAAHLPTVLASLRSELARGRLQPFPICLDAVGRFRQRDYETVYLGPSQDAGATGTPPLAKRGSSSPLDAPRKRTGLQGSSLRTPHDAWSDITSRRRYSVVRVQG